MAQRKQNKESISATGSNKHLRWPWRELEWFQRRRPARRQRRSRRGRAKQRGGTCCRTSFGFAGGEVLTRSYQSPTSAHTKEISFPRRLKRCDHVWPSHCSNIEAILNLKVCSSDLKFGSFPGLNSATVAMEDFALRRSAARRNQVRVGLRPCIRLTCMHADPMVVFIRLQYSPSSSVDCIPSPTAVLSFSRTG